MHSHAGGPVREFKVSKVIQNGGAGSRQTLLLCEACVVVSKETHTSFLMEEKQLREILSAARNTRKAKKC